MQGLDPIRLLRRCRRWKTRVCCTATTTCNIPLSEVDPAAIRDVPRPLPLFIPLLQHLSASRSPRPSEHKSEISNQTCLRQCIAATALESVVPSFAVSRPHLLARLPGILLHQGNIFLRQFRNSPSSPLQGKPKRRRRSSLGRMSTAASRLCRARTFSRPPQGDWTPSQRIPTLSVCS